MFGWLFRKTPAASPAAPDVVLPTPPLVRWTLSQSGLLFIESNETLKTSAYLDSGGVPTIGYGTISVNGVAVKMGDTMTQAQALACLKTDCGRFVTALAKMITVPVTQNQIDALTDFCYNVGSSGFSTSSLRTAINTRQPIVEDLFTRWNKVRDPKTGTLVSVDGLTDRRQREYQLYIS